MKSNLAIFASVLVVVAAVGRRVSADDATPAQPSVRIVLLGDSTVSEYPARHAARGWGQYLPERCPHNVTVFNLAKSGRSTKTFIAEGIWAKALELKPDYVLIQFGHNDSHLPPAPEHTDPATDYKNNLKKFVSESRAIGAVPILISPMHRRRFTSDGKLDDNLRPYAVAMHELAVELEVPFIDLHALSGELYAKLGAHKAQDHASSPQDFTHFNERGARAICNLVCDALPQAVPALGKLLIPNK